jgi:hypothetical protein
MVNTHSGPQNNRNQCGKQLPPPPPNPNMEHFIAAQMQLQQGLTTSVQQIQQNQQHRQQQQHVPQARDKHRDFMSHHPPAFSHAVDALDADDWLKVIGKKLDITQCNDREKVLYASGRLEGATSNWWDAFTVAHANADAITWQEFQVNFHAHHIPSGIMKLKKEFLSLTQGNMSVSEYCDRFTQLSCYAPEEVDTDKKRQERFLEGLIRPLNYQLQSHNFPNFRPCSTRQLVLKAKEKSCLITRESSKGRSAGIPVKTTPKVLSSAPEIRVGTSTTKYNALDNKVRGATNIRTNRGTTLRPVKGLVVNSRIIMEAS